MKANKEGKLIGLYLYSENDPKCKDKKYYLRAHYEYEDGNRRAQIVYPKIHLPIINNALPIVSITDDLALSPMFSQEEYINIGFGVTPLEMDSLYPARSYYIVMEEKTRKMTLAEIEAKLGYKIEIIK